MAATTTHRPRLYSHNLVWEVASLNWVAAVQSSGGGGGDASAANQATEISKLTSIDGHLDVNLSTRLKPADTLAAVTTVGTITNTVPTKEVKAASSAVTSVADTASNVTLLASNASRLGAAVHNDSTVVLYLKLGATATTSSFTVKLVADAYYEVPFGYTGIIDGIWASDASGSARITELTA